VGQTSMHFRQLPQSSASGSSGLNGILMSISPKYTNEPNSSVISKVFFPVKPTPARSATAPSTSSPVSTIISYLTSVSFAFIKVFSAFIFLFNTGCYSSPHEARQKIPLRSSFVLLGGSSIREEKREQLI